MAQDGLSVWEVRVRPAGAPGVELAYAVRAASAAEAESAVRQRRGWPTNLGATLPEDLAATVQVSPLPEQPGLAPLESVERILFDAETLVGLVTDAAKLARAPVAVEPAEGGVFQFRAGPLVFCVVSNASGLDTRVTVDVELDSAERVPVFDGRAWAAPGPWVAEANAVLREVEYAARETRRVLAEHEFELAEDRARRRAERLAAARARLEEGGRY